MVGNYEDLTGQRFGRLLVLERDFNKTNATYGFCKCDCGNMVSVSAHDLKRGHTKSCGCLRKEKTKQLKYKDLTGQKFGRLTVLYSSGKQDIYGNTLGHCRCECGNECDVITARLTQGITKSCGCIRKEKIIKMDKKRLKDLSGQRFGKLTVLKRAPDEATKARGPKGLCQCDCGNTTIVCGRSLVCQEIL